jgi:2-iminobutanoate/2-iminopropanoate deaminase
VKQGVYSPKAPAPIGPYRQAVVFDQLIFCSGQIALNPTLGKLAGDDVETQAVQALENLGAVLRAAGATFEDVVKTTIFLVDMGDFAKVNAVYGRYLGRSAPARSTVAVAGLPLGAKVEIEAIAIRP